MTMSNPFTPQALAPYLTTIHGSAASAVGVTPLGGGRQGDKGYGYGIPLRVDYVLDGVARRAVVDRHCRLDAALLEDPRRFRATEKGLTLITPEMLGQTVHQLR